MELKRKIIYIYSTQSGIRGQKRNNGKKGNKWKELKRIKNKIVTKIKRKGD